MTPTGPTGHLPLARGRKGRSQSAQEGVSSYVLSCFYLGVVSPLNVGGLRESLV